MKHLRDSRVTTTVCNWIIELWNRISPSSPSASNYGRSRERLELVPSQQQLGFQQEPTSQLVASYKTHIE
ncbi:hypothetical protein OWV82_004937 [Melia azedarach]|uniref:Uncharacterized protein n=1 Tax=Melia azedarach TaxID=155640 RepID=A0ACC1YSQ8_MELAZ|nr:hypothetical protein OWV82_004937 [Melia azedarach]